MAALEGGGERYLRREVVISHAGRWKHFLVSAFHTPVNSPRHENLQSTVTAEQSTC